MVANKQTAFSPRIVLTKKMMEDFFTKIFRGDVPELSAETGLPYDLVYNLVHGRIRSLSAEDYRIIFGDEPPRRAQGRVGAEYFRGMVKLWLFLNPGATEAGLYRELNEGKAFKKIDYRVFSGTKVKSVSAQAERWMEEKFLSRGFEKREIMEGIAELETIGYEEKIPYRKIKPLLDDLEKIGVSATKMLNQWSARYESGELQNVPKEVYDRAVRIRAKAEKALDSPSLYAMEKVKEEVYGKRKGLILFSEVRSELQCLKKYGKKSVKRFLGRSIRNYEGGKLKRISAARGKRIKEAFERFMLENPPVPLWSLPEKHRLKEMGKLIAALASVAVSGMITDPEEAYEKSMLRRAVGSFRADAGVQEYVPLDEAAETLGMSAKAFDLLLASHRDLFRKIGKYEGKWFLPYRYLEDLSLNKGFLFIRAKYEWLAKKSGESGLRVREKASQPKRRVEEKGIPALDRMHRGLTPDRPEGHPSSRE
jgi:hypothetical protein